MLNAATAQKGVMSRSPGGVYGLRVECRGLNSYLYYFGASLLCIYNGPQNPNLIIKAPIYLGLGFRGLVVLGLA